MGYYAGYDSRKQIIDEMTAPSRISAPFYKADHEKAGQEEKGSICWPGNGDSLEWREIGNQVTLAKFCSGNNLWVVRENTYDDGRPAFRFIVLIAMSGRTGSRDGWGYKPIEECMGPYQVSCPLKFLDMVPDPGYHYDGTPWRDRVRQYWASRRLNHKIREGDLFKFTSSVKFGGESVERFLVTRINKQRYYDGYRRLTRVQLAKWTEYIGNAKDDPSLLNMALAS